LKAGAGYVPLDPAYPAERLAYMLLDSTPAAVLVQAATADVLTLGSLPVINLDDVAWQAQSVQNPHVPGLTPAHLAYVIYTSGSTGLPKGVQVEHRNVVNLVQWGSLLCPVSQHGALLHKTSISFDASVWEIFWPLCSGLSLVLARPDGQHDPAYLARLIRERQVSVVQFVPVLLQQFLYLPESSQCLSLTDIVCGGGELTVALAEQVRQRLPWARLHNVYGPTETTVDCSVWTLEPHMPVPEATLPIGRPISNTRLYVLDTHDQPVPQGVIGQLHIGGAGVTRGYLNLPQQQAERFIDNPFVDGDRLYRSGDLVRQLADGNIEYLGRDDDQVKIRGFRIELGEIEARLARHEAVKDAVVMAREDVPGDERLVAYYTSRGADETPDIGLLRSHLQTQLPDYMVPSAYVRLDSLPLTANGKLDRKALPAPDQSSVVSHEYEAPIGDTEIAIADLWQDLLSIDQVSRHDHFFELGGHSLLAVKLIERMRQQNMSADVRVLFSQPTLAALAAAVGGGMEIVVPANLIPEHCERITPDMLPLVDLAQNSIDQIVTRVPGGVANVQDIYPLAPLQEGILYHHLMAPEDDPYRRTVIFNFDRLERVQQFAAALQTVITRHDILRTSVLWEDLDEPVQVVWRHAELSVEELRIDPEATDLNAQLQKALDPRHHHLDIRKAPMMRIAYAHDPVNDRWAALLVFHHLVNDATSLPVLAHEIEACMQGQEHLLPASVPYRNYVAQARLGVSLEAHEAFFRDLLGDIDEPTLPFDLHDVQGDGSELEEVRQEVEAELAGRLRQQAQSLGVSAASLYHLAWAQVLSKVTGKDEVVFGTVLMGRMQGGDGADRSLGMFINTLPLRVELGSQGVRNGVKQTHARLTALLGHEHASLVLAQRCSGVQAPTPLFSALLNYRHTDAPSSTAEGLGTWIDIERLKGTDRTNYPLALDVDDEGQGFALTLTCPVDIGAERIAGYVKKALESLVQALEHVPSSALNTLPILPQEELQKLLVDFNATAVPYPQDSTIHQLFEEQVRVQPDAIAVVFEAQRLSYAKLNREANRLAHHLIGLGIVPDDRVAICVERGPAMIVGLLAILKAGAGYVPLDPAYPAERLAYVLQDSAPAAVLVHTATADMLPLDSLPVINLDDAAVQTQYVQNPHVPGLSASHLAYVIYTSGSTGLPKGVQVEHRNVANLVQWDSILCPATQHGALLHQTSISFDASVSEIFWPLCSGLPLVLARPDGQHDPAYLARLIREQHVSVVQFVPVLLQQFLYLPESSQCLSLTDIVCGGGELTVALAEQVRQRLPWARLHNAYGPTETTVDCSAWTLEPHMPVPEATLPIGRPISNTRLYVLDTHDQPVPLGVIGQLHIGGAGVTRGYLNLPQQQAERFIDSPFVDGDRLYRSGDLVRQLADGNLEYLGRNDDQVKIRGFRIELGEIEARLSRHPTVQQAVVMAREDVPGDKRLVAYLTAQEGAVLSAAQLREQLSQGLAEYMIPSAFVTLARFPLTPNGKLDRRALPAPEDDAYASRDYEAPAGDIEHALAQIWQVLLGLERVGRHDHFFELGGHSLLAVQLVSRLRQRFEVEVALRDVFAEPTLQGLARQVANARLTAQTPLTLVDRDLPLPLSWAQQRLWFLDQLDRAAGAAYHIPAGLRLRGRLDSEALQATLDRIVARHETLRTHFALHEGQAIQVIAPATQGFALVTHDLRALDSAAQHKTQDETQHEAVERLAGEEALAPFDLSSGPLIRGRLVQLSETEHILLVTQHHIVSDGWSTGVLLHEIGTLYRAFSQGLADPLPALAFQYVDYAAWQRQWLQGETLQTQVDFWRQHLSGAPALLELPTDHRRPPLRSYAGGRVSLALSPALTAGLRQLGQRHGATLFMTLLAGWSSLLSRFSGQDDVVIGTPVANRPRSELESLIGFFVNTLALRIRPEVGLSVAALLEQVKAVMLAAHAHQDLPFEQVVEALQPPRSLGHSPIFQVMLALNNTPGGGEFSLPELSLEPLQAPHTTAQFDLSLALVEADGGLVGSLEYASDLFERATIERMAGHLQVLLEGMVADDQQAVAELPLLSCEQRRQVLESFNDTAAAYPADKLLHQLFEEQVAQQPDALAVVDETGSLTYGELNARANRLAHYLIGLGIQPDDRVAICAQRSLEMVVGLLGILKAGGAYVPLDPGYPPERLRYMLEDSAPVAVLVQTSTADVLSLGSLPVINLDDAALQAQSVQNPHVQGLTPAHLAYVIYTSGSTGLPKGVQVEHRNVARLFSATDAWFGFNANDVWALFHSFAFDFSVWEIWGALVHGGQLLIVPHLVSRSPQECYALLCDTGVTVLNQTPSAFRQLIAAQGESQQSHSLRQVIFGGEALDTAMLQPWYARPANAGTQLANMYGITETTVHVTYYPLQAADAERTGVSPIGRQIPDLQLYVLDALRQPVPLGVAGELYVGGAGVARDYLNRPDLNEERFLANPFSEQPGARLYRTGDLVRWLADGSLEYMGRNDDQVKIRGFRIEPGEIEDRLSRHPQVQQAVVMAREDVPSDKRLVAYFTSSAENDHLHIETLRAHLQAQLPDYMVPTAYVRLESMPLTPNGKLDRKALPAPDLSSVISREYQAPQGATERAIADIWQDLLSIDQVGRHDHFFELGGHSLLAVKLIERMRQQNMSADVRVLFSQPTLVALAAAVGGGTEVVVPANPIEPGCRKITPDMLPLVDLNQDAIDRIVTTVPGGAANVQDIYALAPLQEGILYHHLMAAEGDPYLQYVLFGFDSLERVHQFAAALQTVIARHDILRTSVLWEGLDDPVQVVWREAHLTLERVLLEPTDGDIAARLHERFDPRHHRLDLRQAPLMHMVCAHDPDNERWVAMLRFHHLIDDVTSLAVISREVEACMLGQEQQLPASVPYRNYVAQARLGVSIEAHEAFFRDLLGDIDEPTLPFDLHDVQGDGSGVKEVRLQLDSSLSKRLRVQARQLGVSAACLHHLAWAQVLSRISGKDDVVFGTVLMGRMNGGEGADRALGMFINTLPMRINVGYQGAQASVQAIHAQLSALLEHEHASLALAQRCSGVAAPAPLFSALLNYRHSAAGSASAEALYAWHGIEVLGGEERTNYPLTLNVDDLGDGFKLTALVAGQADAQRVCAYMQAALESLVEALEHAPQALLHNLSILPEQERHQLMVDFNATTLDYPLEQTIHGLFEAQVERTPQAVAVVHGDVHLSYRELNNRANQLAHHLRDIGVKPDSRVAICVERSEAMVVGLLAILKAGGGYVPLDPAYPADRIAYMLQDSAPAAVLAQNMTLGLLADVSVPLINLDAAALQAQSVQNPHVPGLTAAHLAYVIYTSGSTGLPKGVMIEHRNTVNFLTWAHQSFDSTVLAKTLFSTSLNFDLAVYECFAPLTCGGSINVVTDVLALQQDEHDVSLINTVPSALKALLESGGLSESVHTVNVAGEALKRSLVESLFEQTRVKRLCNLYGPSETTTYSSWVSMDREQGFAAHIGKPVGNTQFYLLDKQMQPVPLGVPGEIYIGGAGVARGYLNRDDLTAERFLSDPFSKIPNARMYKTGDLGRWLADGNIEYLGRNDDQVKIRGFRIELGEVEACLARHKEVKEAVVMAREDVPGDKRLVAYFTADSEVSLDVLREHLMNQLPDYMVPAAYVRLESLPLTPNGKLDRKALPAPDQLALVSREYEAPQGATEQVIANIWQDLLGIDQVGRHDHFFELGGHSLLAVKLIERMRHIGLNTDVRMLFNQSTVAALSAAIGNGRRTEVVVPANLIPKDGEHIAPDMLPLVDLNQDAIDRIVTTVHGGAANVQDIYALAPLQEGILYHHLSAERGDPYVLKSVFAFQDQARLDAFSQALQQLIQRHDILRTSLLWEGLDEPVQVVWRQAFLSMETLDLDPAQGDISTQLQHRYDPRHYRLNLGQAPLMRLVSAYDAPNQRIVSLLLCHHLVLDHTAMEVMRHEVQALMLGESHELPASVPYRNYVAQARLGVSIEAHETFFRDLLGDIDEPTLPFDLRDVQGDGRVIEEVHQRIDSTLSKRLRAQARQSGVSAASLVHLAWAQVVGRFSARDVVVFGTVLMGRMSGSAGTDRALGMFINTLPMRIDLGHQGAQASVKATHAQLSALLEHEHASLALAQRCSGVTGDLPLFSALLNYRHSGDEALTTEADAVWAGIQSLGAEERSNYPLALNVDDLGEDFVLNAQTVVDIGAQRVCNYMQAALESLVHVLEHAPQAPLYSFSVMPEQERDQLMVGFNATEFDYPLEQTLHGLFEALVERTPQAVALVHGDLRLSYRELNNRANQLAHHLIDSGARPDGRVAICAERSESMVIGLLAILKAGSSYVPLDPAYPADRIAHMLQDSAPAAVLTHSATRGLLADVSVPVIDLDTQSLQDQPVANPHVPGLTSAHLAYVLYTSGSTGTPKGVMNEHRGVVNRLLWARDHYRVNETDRVLQKTPFGFDVSVWEFFLPLLAGAQLHMARPGGHQDPAYMAQVIREQRITLMHFVPSMLEAFLEHGDSQGFSDLRRVLCSGEALPGHLVRRFKTQMPGIALHNLYGPTEAAIDVTAWDCSGLDTPDSTPIGKPVANTRIYLLDAHQQPVPFGVAGEIYIGGVQVARGYLNLAQLTAERFIKDPFCDDPSARLYRTGDLGRWLADGNIEYLGRNDFQVKIRGLRIEPGEIEDRLSRHPGVQQAVVMAREDVPGDKRLVAYFTAEPQVSLDVLREYLLAQLPDYMVPTAYVHLEKLPLTSSGKLDRKALPAPDLSSVISREYQAPQGATERAIAEIWQDLLSIDQVGRHDHFFELGGHSLLAVKLIERMRQVGLSADVRVLFSQPTLVALAAAVGGGQEIVVPANLIPKGGEHITPDMLPLVDLSQAAIDHIVATVPGGVANVQDIYPLAPLQEGILYHHLMAAEGDPYLQYVLFGFDRLERVHQFAAALQTVIARHDILRTSVLWEGLDDPVQVVWREAHLTLEHVLLEPTDGDIAARLHERFDPRHHRLDLRQAPLMHMVCAQDPANERWVAMLRFHHLIDDVTSLAVISREVEACMLGQEHQLPASVPYRNYVAQARLGVSIEAHEAFFRELLGDIDEPTLPFDLHDVQGDGIELEEVRQQVDAELARRLRQQAKNLGVSVASLYHLAWAQVLSKVTGKDEVVFGTVLVGRMQGGDGADRSLGMFINTLPLRVELGKQGVRNGVKQTHARLTALLGHEHASLVLAQRCSGVQAPTPLFSALLNYRHSGSEALSPQADAVWTGIQMLGGQERTNYPLTLNVDDLGEDFVLNAQTVVDIGAQRICNYMQAALQSLAEALEHAPQAPLHSLSILPEQEHHQLMVEFNTTTLDYPVEQTLHGLFEAQVERTPQALAVVHGDVRLSYYELNNRANQLAHQLIGLGIGPDDRVAICVERGPGLIVGLLALLKAGAGYVPLDPAYPAERLAYMLLDSTPAAVLVQAATADVLT
ncbi:non-ribosomal peptide synthetase, partial [Pseudomonas syringae]